MHTNSPEADPGRLVRLPACLELVALGRAFGAPFGRAFGAPVAKCRPLSSLP